MEKNAADRLDTVKRVIELLTPYGYGDALDIMLAVSNAINANYYRTVCVPLLPKLINTQK